MFVSMYINLRVPLYRLMTYDTDSLLFYNIAVLSMLFGFSCVLACLWVCMHMYVKDMV